MQLKSTFTLEYFLMFLNSLLNVWFFIYQNWKFFVDNHENYIVSVTIVG
jgi:hypothetical protein